MKLKDLLVCRQKESCGRKELAVWAAAPASCVATALSMSEQLSLTVLPGQGAREQKKHLLNRRFAAARGSDSYLAYRIVLQM